jgi:hypothetical protein
MGIEPESKENSMATKFFLKSANTVLAKKKRKIARKFRF